MTLIILIFLFGWLLVLYVVVCWRPNYQTFILFDMGGLNCIRIRLTQLNTAGGLLTWPAFLESEVLLCDGLSLKMYLLKLLYAVFRNILT